MSVSESESITCLLPSSVCGIFWTLFYIMFCQHLRCVSHYHSRTCALHPRHRSRTLLFAPWLFWRFFRCFTCCHLQTFSPCDRSEHLSFLVLDFLEFILSCLALLAPKQSTLALACLSCAWTSRRWHWPTMRIRHQTDFRKTELNRSFLFQRFYML